MNRVTPPLHLRLPATSANLGPGFDALGLALALYLTIDATHADEFLIEATGRDADLCGDPEKSLILSTYRDLLLHPAPIALKLHNEIPLGRGCGSSAAALLAGVLLANHFGALGWSRDQILAEACRREGHPDNVAACWGGWLTASMMASSGHCYTATCGYDVKWKIILAVPGVSLATTRARALLPDTYSRADAVANVQATALLVSAFALNRIDLLHAGMQDQLHQPFRLEVCPLLAKLLPLTGRSGISGVALSGAGPSVLLIVEATAKGDELTELIRTAANDTALEVIFTMVAAAAAVY